MVIENFAKLAPASRSEHGLLLSTGASRVSFIEFARARFIHRPQVVLEWAGIAALCTSFQLPVKEFVRGQVRPSLRAASRAWERRSKLGEPGAICVFAGRVCGGMIENPVMNIHGN